MTDEQIKAAQEWLGDYLRQLQRHVEGRDDLPDVVVEVTQYGYDPHGSSRWPYVPTHRVTYKSDPHLDDMGKPRDAVEPEQQPRMSDEDLAAFVKGYMENVEREKEDS